jgi:hypothetical protein
MEDEIKTLSKEEIAKHILQIKQDVYNRVSVLEDDIIDLKHSMSQANDDRKQSYELQKQMQEQLNKLFTLVESQSKNIDELRSRQEESDNRFIGHDDKEMEKWDSIVDAIENFEKIIKEVAEETENNTSFIDKLKKYWFGLTVSGLTIVTIAGAVWWLIIELEKRGLLILFPTN